MSRRGTGGVLRPTLEDVAARAGVGRGTASRALNGSAGVRGQTREVVRAAADELGYRPNLAARSLVTRRTGAVALLMGESQDRLFADPFFAHVVRGVSRALGSAGYQLVLLSLGPHDDRRSALSYLAGRHTDGVLLASSHQATDVGTELRAHEVPVVRIGRHRGEATALPWVDVDNVGAGRWATEHLLARGCRAPATLTGPLDMHPAWARREGYRQALGAWGVVAREVSGQFTRESGYALARRLLTDRPETDGIFAQSDELAAGALQALREAGRAAPGQVRVVGFDDSAAASLTSPALTTVRQPIADLGTRAASLLVDLLQHRPDPVTEVLLPVRLVVRDSS